MRRVSRYAMTNSANPDLFRLLPSVDEVKNSEAVQEIIRQYGYRLTIEYVRLALDELREVIKKGELDERQIRADVSRLPKDILFFLQRWFGYSLRPVINATGVILHTNLGRAPLSHSALEHVTEILAATPTWNSISLPASAVSATFTSVACLRNC